MKSLPKIDRPPAVEHWSRMQHPDAHRTARKLFAFLRGGVSWNYAPSRNVARYHIEDQITRDVALRIVQGYGNPIGRKYNLEVVDAMFDYFGTNPIDSVRAFSELVEWFPIAPGAAVPIKPLMVTREGGRFVPNFFNPWSQVPFDSYQASLYMTILEKSIFRLTDFEDSPGRFVFFPKVQIGGDILQRRPLIWKRGQFPLLSDSDLNSQIRIFAESKEIAKAWYLEFIEKNRKQ